MELKINKYESEDERQILELFKNSFERELTKEYWDWRYGEGIINEKYINLMWDDNLLVGHYAVFPTYLKYNNYKIKSGFSMTTMTHKNYGKKGIFTNLAKNLFENNYNNLEVIWGFPNNNSVHGFIKNLNWRIVSNLTMLQKNISDSIHLDSIGNFFEIKTFDFSFDELFVKVSEKFKLIVVRDSKYLNWRYNKNPINKYYKYAYKKNNVLKGYVIYKIYQSEGECLADIVDIVAETNEDFEAIIKNLLNVFYTKGILKANMWMLYSEFNDILIKLGFNKTDSKTYFGAMINSDKIASDLFDNSSWYITMGDSDVF